MSYRDRNCFFGVAVAERKETADMSDSASGQRPDTMGTPQPREKDTDVMGGPEPASEQPDVMGGPEPADEKADVMDGPEPTESGNV
jgi:hypothetical protein